MNLVSLGTTEDTIYEDWTVESETAYRYEVVAEFDDEGSSDVRDTIGWTSGGWRIEWL